MKQTLNFVPVRLLVAGLLVVAAAIYSPARANVAILLVSAEQDAIDPIVTGANTPDEDKNAWEARRKKFEECGLCGEIQPFPEELKK